MEKKCDLLLREYTRDSFWLTYFWKDKSFGFLKTHDIVVLLQPEYGMLEKGNTVAIPVQEHRQIVFDIFLGEIVRKLLKIQNSLGDLQAVVVDTAVGILSQTKFFGKPTPNREKSQACLRSALPLGLSKNSSEVRARLCRLLPKGRKKEENEVRKRYAFLKFRNSFNRPVQGIVGHGVLWCRGRLRALLA